MVHPSFQQYGKNVLCFIVYNNEKLVRFTNFHPIHNSEGFFYNVLLQKIPFHDEKNLLSNCNIHQSYVYECQIQNWLPNLESLHKFLQQYVTLNIFEDEKQTQLFNKMLELHPYLDLEHHQLPNPSRSSILNLETKQCHINFPHHIFNDMFETSILHEEPKHIFYLLTFINKGLHTFQGPLGSKKTFFCEIFGSSTSSTRQKSVAFSYNRSYCITIIITCIYCTLGESMIK